MKHVNLRALILSSLRFRYRGHMGVLLGAAVSCAALIGALIVGDAVRGTLRDRALERLGWITAALAPVDRFFSQDLADRFMSSAEVRGELPQRSTQASSALRLPGTASRQDGSARANRVQVLGVTSNFWQGGASGKFTILPNGSVILNEALAAHLDAKLDDHVVLRVHKPSALSRDVPITPQNDASIALRMRVFEIASEADLGNFSLQANSIQPFNAFVRLDELERPAGLSGKANLLLMGDPGNYSFVRPADVARWERSVVASMTLADFGLDTHVLTNRDVVEIRTSRIFLDSIITSEFTSDSTPRAMAAFPILTYLVNGIRAGDRITPYSMITAAGPPWTPRGMRDDEILVNQWLADDLKLRVGDRLELAYFLPESGAHLFERTHRFTVRGIVPLDSLHGDQSLMPELPGLVAAESTHDWDAGFPLVHKIRDEDEAYWKRFRGTPKAFVTWAAGQSMWANRFGNATGIRIPLSEHENPRTRIDEVSTQLKSKLDPANFGLQFLPVRAQALDASLPSQDFGELFLGFSFFLILAALILMALLFQFGLEQRTNEVGTLLAIGFAPARIRRLLLAEGVIIALAGGSLGVAGGIGYAKLLLKGLATIWRDAVGSSALQFHMTTFTLAIGLCSSVIVGVLTLWIVLKRQVRRTAGELLAQGADSEPAGSQAGNLSNARLAHALVICSGLAAIGLICWAVNQHESSSPQIFFGAGSLLLLCGLGGVALLFRRWQRADAGIDLTIPTLGFRAATRRRNRSLATVSLLACGSFLIVAVGANRLESGRDVLKRSSGTGGFALLGESSLPIVKDLNSQSGREFYGLAEAAMAGVRVLPFKVRDGDDASCLNLNRPQRPRLLGLRPEMMAERDAFTFAQIADGLSKDRPWLALKRDPFPVVSGKPLQADEVPAIGDAASIRWALRKKVGDTIDYTDERGRGFKLRLVGAVANSILQGNLLIDEAEFVRRFPGETGHRMFLIDIPSNKPLSNLTAILSRSLQDVGLELTPTTARLSALNAVQNTYLSTFQILGGLGLLLGSVGLGVVVLRNVLERRGELALLRAVGYRRRMLHGLVLREHCGLLVLGVGVGMLAALAAVLPVLLAPGAKIHTLALTGTLAGVLATGLLWTWLATRYALRGDLLDGLRNE
jgi:putative ABC transport system permease protein